MTTTCKETCEPAETVMAEASPRIERPVYEPAADVIEKPDAIHVLLDLLGVDQKGLDVTVEENVLRVHGTSAIAQDKPESPIHREFETCDYERSFRVATDIDAGRISASIKNGLLRLVLPKKEKEKPQKISVRTE